MPEFVCPRCGKPSSVAFPDEPIDHWDVLNAICAQCGGAFAVGIEVELD